MDILPLHIEYLLTRHDCVIVPGLGAFIATETEAFFDCEGGTIRPRRREISFNSSVVTDDGLLAHSLARRERLNYEDARRQLSLLAERMRADLDNEGEVSIGMVGRLFKDSEGLISFHPRSSAIATDIMPVVTLSAAEAVSELAADEALPEPALEEETALEDEEGVRIIKVKADRYVFTVNKRFAHVAAMLVAILAIGLSLFIPMQHSQEQKASVISIEEIFRRTAKKPAEAKKDSDSAKSEISDSIPSKVASKTSETGRNQ